MCYYIKLELELWPKGVCRMFNICYTMSRSSIQHDVMLRLFFMEVWKCLFIEFNLLTFLFFCYFTCYVMHSNDMLYYLAPFYVFHSVFFMFYVILRLVMLHFILSFNVTFIPVMFCFITTCFMFCAPTLCYVSCAHTICNISNILCAQAVDT